MVSLVTIRVAGGDRPPQNNPAVAGLRYEAMREMSTVL